MLHTLIYRHLREAAGAVIPRGTQEEDSGRGIGNITISEEPVHDPMEQFRGFYLLSSLVTAVTTSSSPPLSLLTPTHPTWFG